ncbi:MAG: TrbI/VirB10 family protein [Burkholderiaceae bacterium]|nr:MAG: TrbI/VirB10 family protein [Burkholderiaceae bacterium]TBR76161.1 MAG: TrbI/VirB10 family protein [Burkholderiaceae bacterium]
MAKPITDPMREDRSDITDVDISGSEHEEISRGMPARNYKMWLIAAGAIGVAGMLLWPGKHPGPKPPSQNQNLSQGGNPGDKFVKALIQDANTQKTPAPIVVPPAATVPAASGTAASSLFGKTDGGEPKMTPEQEREARLQTIIASPTEAVGVKLDHHFDTGQSPNTAQDGALAAQAKSVTDAQKALVDTLKAGGMNQAGAHAAQGPDASGLPGAKKADANFLQTAGEKGIQPAEHMSNAHPGLALYEGTIVRTVLDKGINTDLPGSIRAHVTSDVYDSVYGTHLLIPRGSVVIGEYNTGLVAGQDRVLVALTRLILPNGQSVSLMGTPAEDGQGVSGLPADIDNHYLKIFGASLMVGAASMLLPNQQQNITVNMSPSGIQEGGTVFGTTLQEAITNLSKRNLNIQPTGTVDVGAAFLFTITRDIVMDDYAGRLQP